MTGPSTLLTLLLTMACCACSSSSHAPGVETASAGAEDTSAKTSEVGCARASDADTYSAGMEKAGEAGRYRFELVSSTPAPPALGDNTFVLQVRGADGSPMNGQLGIALDMPQHGHPSPAAPRVRFDDRAQAFTLEPMDLFMVGLWRITFTFQPDAASGQGSAAGEPATAEGTDSAVFKFCIE